MSRGPSPSIETREILRFFVESPDPGFTANEVADEFDKTRQWADNRLKTVEEEEGYISSKNPGGGAKFYWITTAGKAYLADTRES